MNKFFKKWRIFFEGLIGTLIVQPFAWVTLKYAFGPRAPVEFLIGAMMFLFIVSFWFFCSCITPDKKEFKPRWW
jgi:hypothetical protein